MSSLRNVLWNAPVLGVKRKPVSETDFGDERTVGLKLKTSGKDFGKLEDHDFAFYLGFYEGEWHVGTHRICEFSPSKLKSYISLEELKKDWILD